jgi:hypothetical protein
MSLALSRRDCQIPDAGEKAGRNAGNCEREYPPVLLNNHFHGRTSRARKNEAAPIYASNALFCR